MIDDRETNLPFDMALSNDAPPRRRWFRKRYLLVFPIPVFMFAGAGLGMQFQRPGLQKSQAHAGLQPGAGSETSIALPAEIILPPGMAQTMLPSDVVGLARVMPRGDVSIVAAPYADPRRSRGQP